MKMDSQSLGKPRLLGLVGFTAFFHHFYRHSTDTAGCFHFTIWLLSKHIYPQTTDTQALHPTQHKTFNMLTCVIDNIKSLANSLCLIFVCEHDVIREYRTDVCPAISLMPRSKVPVEY